jgi:hypothetical protein
MPDWLPVGDFVAKVAVGVATVGVGVLLWLVAKRQADTARDKLKLDLYDRRYAIYTAVIRPLAVGRNNWLQIGGDGGLRTASVLLSVCASATRHRLNPWVYLRDVLDRLAARSVGDDLGDLLPDAWAIRLTAGFCSSS